MARREPTTPSEPATKCCAKCGDTKPLDDFYRCQAASDGHQSYCKSCSKVGVRGWWRDNPDRLQEHISLNEEQRAVARLASHARARGCTHVESISPLAVLELGDGVCGICGEDVDPLDFNVDHVVPILHGGLHTYANAQPAHPTCNKQKSSKLVEV